jgi:hypothetical protein
MIFLVVFAFAFIVWHRPSGIVFRRILTHWPGALNLLWRYCRATPGCASVALPLPYVLD